MNQVPISVNSTFTGLGVVQSNVYSLNEQIVSIQQSIIELELESAGLVAETGQLSGQLSDISQENGNLQTSLNNLTVRVSTLEGSLSSLDGFARGNIGTLIGQFNYLYELTAAQQGEINALKALHIDQQDKINILRGHIEDLQEADVLWKDRTDTLLYDMYNHQGTVNGLNGRLGGVEQEISLMTNGYSPVGSIIIWPDDYIIPSGYVPCDGRQLNRTTYSALFAILGDRYQEDWVPDVGMFRIPDLRNLYVRGSCTTIGGNRTFNVLGANVTSTFLPETVGVHNHQMKVLKLQSMRVPKAPTVGGNDTCNYAQQTRDLEAYNGGNYVENKPNSLCLNYIIKII